MFNIFLFAISKRYAFRSAKLEIIFLFTKNLNLFFQKNTVDSYLFLILSTVSCYNTLY
jgi:hypothetical protein